MFSEATLAKMRQPKYSHRRLTADQAREIRERFAEGGETVTDLARAYGVRRTTVRQLLEGATYRDAGGPTHTPKKRVDSPEPRPRQYICTECCNLPHVRPPGGCENCGRPHRPEPEPRAEDQLRYPPKVTRWDRV